MSSNTYKVAIKALDVPPREKSSNFPEPFASRLGGRDKHKLGDQFGLTNFGVNITRIAPSAISAIRHAHSRQDEFVYILSGHPVLITNEGETQLNPGMCAGFKAGTGNAHQLVNRTNEDVLYLEIGDRSKGDSTTFPDDDLNIVRDSDGNRSYFHKDGTPY